MQVNKRAALQTSAFARKGSTETRAGFQQKADKTIIWKKCLVKTAF